MSILEEQNEMYPHFLQTDFNTFKNEIKTGTVKGNLHFRPTLKKRLDRNEILFVHSLVIYIISYRFLTEKESAIYHSKFDQFVEYMSDICNVPFFDEQRREYLLQKAQKIAIQFSYKLNINVLETYGINEIASRGEEDRVFLQIEIESNRNKQKKSLQLFQIRYNGQWMPKYKWLYRKFQSLEINLSSFTIDNDSLITFKLVVLKLKKDLINSLFSLLPFGDRAFCTKQTFPIVSLRPSEVTWSGLRRIFSFNCEANQIQIILKIKWKLRSLNLAQIFSKRYCDLEGQIFQQFLSHRWKKRSPQIMFSCKCDHGSRKMGTLFFEQFLSQEIWKNRSQFWPKPLEASAISSNLTTHALEKNKKFCITNEWCNIHSFYFYNPIARFLLYQNHHLFGVPDHLIIPYHFKAICAFINIKNYNCFSLLSSSLKFLNFYLKESVDASDSSTVYRFWRSSPSHIILDGYFHLRNFLTKTESFRLASRPFDHYSEGFRYFVQALIWLEEVIYCLEDNKLYRKLRYKFQELLISWVIMILNNPSLNISTHIIRMIIKTDQNQEEGYNIYFSNLDSKSSLPTFYFYSMESIRNASFSSFDSLKSMNETFLKTSIPEEKIKKKSYFSENLLQSNPNQYEIIIYCSKQVSLLHKLVDFVNQMVHIIPFDFYDKCLYENEVKMIWSIDYAFKTKSQLSDYYIEIKNEDHKQIPKPLKLLFLEYYKIFFYSVAYDLQSFIIDHLLYTYYKEFNFNLQINRIKFFSTNQWIENVCRQVIEGNNITIFTSNDVTFELIKNLFYSLQNYWNVPLHQRETLKNIQLFKSVAYECISFGYWSEKFSENFFQTKVQTLNQVKKKLTDELDFFIDSTLRKINQSICQKSFQKSSNKISQTEFLVIVNLVKGYCLNLKNICIYWVQLCDEVLEQSNEKLGFNIFCPAWIEIISLNEILKESLEECRKKYSKYDSLVMTNMGSTINGTINATIKQINQIVSSIYVNLIKSWLKEVHFLKFKWYKEKHRIKSKLIPNDISLIDGLINILRLIVIIGYYEFSKFKFTFEAQYNFLNEQLKEKLSENEMNEIRELIKTLQNLSSNIVSNHEKWKILLQNDVKILNEKYYPFYNLIKSWENAKARPYNDKLILN